MRVLDMDRVGTREPEAEPQESISTCCAAVLSALKCLIFRPTCSLQLTPLFPLRFPSAILRSFSATNQRTAQFATGSETDRGISMELAAAAPNVCVPRGARIPPLKYLWIDLKIRAHFCHVEDAIVMIVVLVCKTTRNGYSKTIL
jgi:hypothetical protein